MTAASAYPPPPHELAEGRPPEPSMEDILASIRRIIADDQGAGRPAGNNGARPAEGAPAPARARTPYDDVLDLARLVPSAEGARGVPQAAEERHAAGELTPAEGGAVSGLRARMPEPAGRAAHDEERDMLDHPVPALSHEDDEELLSPPLGDSVMSAFETLAATVVLQNTPMLERVMRDLLRPMLKTWLDDNLPGLVERLVRAEIERVARGPRG